MYLLVTFVLFLFFLGVMNGSPPLYKVILAFLAVYIIWGSTYLAIAISIETIPPFLMAGSRFVVAGLILVCLMLLKGVSLPTWTELKASSLSGIFLIIGGNMTVVWAEQYIPSGVAAIVIASTPIWLVLMDRTQWSMLLSRPLLGTGLVIGFGGVLYLVLNGGAFSNAPKDTLYLGIFLVIVAAALWSVGTLYSRNPKHHTNSLMKSGLQMLVGGGIIMLISILNGELTSFEPQHVSLRSGLALVYLIVFGALIGYSSFVWLVKVRPPAQVGTYAYVNPTVAVLLGWWLLGEPLTIHTIIALMIIVGGVFLVNRSYATGKVISKK